MYMHSYVCENFFKSLMYFSKFTFLLYNFVEFIYINIHKYCNNKMNIRWKWTWYTHRLTRIVTAVFVSANKFSVCSLFATSLPLTWNKKDPFNKWRTLLDFQNESLFSREMYMHNETPYSECKSDLEKSSEIPRFVSWLSTQISHSRIYTCNVSENKSGKLIVSFKKFYILSRMIFCISCQKTRLETMLFFYWDISLEILF